MPWKRSDNEVEGALEKHVTENALLDGKFHLKSVPEKSKVLQFDWFIKTFLIEFSYKITWHQIMRRVKRCFAKAKQRYEPFDIIIRFRHSQNNVELSSSGNIISVFRARRAQRASPVLKYLNFGGNTSLPEVVKLELGTYLLANVLLNINTPSPTIENLILQIAGKCTAVSSLPSLEVYLAAVSDQIFFIRPHGYLQGLCLPSLVNLLRSSGQIPEEICYSPFSHRFFFIPLYGCSYRLIFFMFLLNWGSSHLSWWISASLQSPSYLFNSSVLLYSWALHPSRQLFHSSCLKLYLVVGKIDIFLPLLAMHCKFMTLLKDNKIHSKPHAS